jgi:LemA protein
MKRKTLFVALITILLTGLITLGILFVLNDDSKKTLGICLLVLAGIVMIAVVSGYNKMIRYHNKIKESLALVDIQLKLRFDLIPNLVKVVKKHASHEKELFEEIVALRNQAASSVDEKEKLEYANKLVPYMKNVIAVAESYPDLKSSALFKNLMEQLVDVEDRLVSARRIYDSNVNIYNTTLQVFPNSLLAYMFEFKKEELFKIDAGEAINVNVKEELSK